MENYRFVIREYHADKCGIGNVLKCLITALSINDDVTIQCYPEYEYGAYDTILDDSFIFDESRVTTKELVRVNTCRLLLLYYEDEIQEDLPNEYMEMDPIHPRMFHWYFSKTKRIDWHYDPSKVDERVRARIFNSIQKIKWKPIVTDTVSVWTSAFSKQVTLGISVRTWKASHESDIRRPYEMEVYQKEIDRVIQEHPEVETFVLSVDRIDCVMDYIRYLSTTYPSRSLVWLSPLPHLLPIQYAISKALTLSHCTYFIGNRISTFSELVYWFGRCRPVVYPVY
jgi:hypothetical protein